MCSIDGSPGTLPPHRLVHRDQVAGITVSLSLASSCCGTWPKAYCGGWLPGASVKVHTTSNRSPGQGDGITVPVTSGNAEASAGMWSCSQQIKTTPKLPLTTL